MARKDPTILKTEDESDAIIFQGASVSQLARMANLDERTIKDRIIGKVRSVGTRYGHKVYNVIEAAQFLMRDKVQAKLQGIDMKLFCAEFIAQMETASDLPLPVRNSYYQARLTKLQFEERQGSLVPLALVKEVTANAFKVLRQQVLLAKDRIEREVELPPAARQILIAELDSAITNLQKALLEAYPEPKQLAPDGADDEFMLDIQLEEETARLKQELDSRHAAKLTDFDDEDEL